MKRNLAKGQLREYLRVAKSLFWGRYYLLQSRLLMLTRRRGNFFLFTGGLLLVLFSVSQSAFFQEMLELHFSGEKQLEGLQSTILNVGSALIGAAAIVTSLVLFAMQVNIERMPHGLFRKLSADARLLGAFFIAFLLALGIAFLSTLVTRDRLGVISLVAFWSVVGILLSFLYAYRRALLLVNPLQQLAILRNGVRRNFNGWANRATRLVELIKVDESPSSTSTHDMHRVVFFRAYPGWDSEGLRAVRHAISFYRRYADVGDYEVAGAAVTAVVHINQFYVAVRHKTFFAENGFIEMPLASDRFISDSLEHFRQQSTISIAAKDEQQIKLVLNTFVALIDVYLDIDYSNEYVSKSHAMLASGYLADFVTKLGQLDLPDVLMEGQRALGRVAKLTLLKGRVGDINFVCEKIADVALMAVLKEPLRPAVQAGIAQLADISLRLILGDAHGDEHVSNKIKEQVTAVAKAVLLIPSNSLSRTHSYLLGDYYSSTSSTALLQRLQDIANSLLDEPAESDQAKRTIRNLAKWAERRYQQDKELLLFAISAESPFIFDIISWITSITRLLMAVSSAPAVEQHWKEELQKHAQWLIATLTWIPDEAEKLALVENYSVIEMAFEVGVDSHTWDCADIADDVVEILLGLGFKGAGHSHSWGLLDESLLAASVLATGSGDFSIARLKKSVIERIIKSPNLDADLCRRSARELLDAAENLHRRGRMLSRVDAEISSVDQLKLKSVLMELAGLISPARPGGATM